MQIQNHVIWDEQAIQTQYKPLTMLNEKVALMEHEDGTFVIQKKIENTDVYGKLIGIRHPNLPIEFGISCTPQGEYYAYEEYIAGRSLDSYLQEHGTLDKKFVRTVCMEICLGLSKLHELGIIHRDIKPEHIILTPDGKVKLIDFGAAREHKAEAGMDTRQFGTKGFAAPEQYGFAQTTKRTDIYAMGVMTVMLLSGKIPSFGSDTIPVPFPFRVIVTQCTNINPLWRITSAKRLYKAYKHMISRLVWYGYAILLIVQFIWLIVRALLAFDGPMNFFS